jgi:GTP-binding protein EngB required for normal cell division
MDQQPNESRRCVNTFPSCIRPKVFNISASPKIYSFTKDHYIASNFEYYLDINEDTYNVLVIGPTGAGKSHLINVIFNQEISDSKSSHFSVTREICFIKGRGRVYSEQRKNFVERSVCVIDTIGLCDTEWNDEIIINLIKGRVSNNFKHIDVVLIVFKTDRIQPSVAASIKKVLEWLKYRNNWARFQFICTHSENVENEEEDTLREQAISILGLRDTTRSFFLGRETLKTLIYSGFPQERTLNDLTRDRVKESWRQLNLLLTVPGNSSRISLQESGLCNIL